MVLATVWTSSYWFVVIIVIVLVLWVQRALIIATVIPTRRRRILVVLSIIGVVLCLLARLLPLASLHPSLFQQTSFFRQTLALFPIFDFILADQSHGRVTKYVFVLAEFAYPWLGGWIVEVGVLLLDATLASSVLVQFGGTTPWFSRRRGLLWWWGARWTSCSPIGEGWRGVCTRTIHVGAGLGTLGRHHRGIWADGRACTGSLMVG